MKFDIRWVSSSVSDELGIYCDAEGVLFLDFEGLVFVGLVMGKEC